jgi:hypothetical protein
VIRSGSERPSRREQQLLQQLQAEQWQLAQQSAVAVESVVPGTEVHMQLVCLLTSLATGLFGQDSQQYKDAALAAVGAHYSRYGRIDPRTLETLAVLQMGASGVDMVGLGAGRCGWAGLGWAGLGWAGLGWAELGWAGLGWAGLGWAGLGWAGLGRALGRALGLRPACVAWRGLLAGWCRAPGGGGDARCCTTVAPRRWARMRVAAARLWQRLVQVQQPAPQWGGAGRPRRGAKRRRRTRR